MLQDSEVLDAVPSFLDLPAEFTTLDEEGLTIHDTRNGLLSPRPPEHLAFAIEEDYSFEGLYEPQTSAPLDACLANSVVDTLELGVLVGDSPPPGKVLSPTSSEDSSQSSKGKKKTGNKKPSRPRITQKQRIETLRETVRGLNAELQSLQPDRASMTRSVDGQLIPRRSSMWEQIAARQLERRLQSEEENAKLREMQMQEARSLKRMLKRRTKIDMMENMLGMKRHKVLDYGIPEDNPEVFEDMLRGIDELYVGTDALFTEKGLYNLPYPGRHREAKRNVANGLFLELMQRHLVPFDLRTTEKAMYKVMHQMGFQGLQTVENFADRVQFHSHHIEESSNTIKASVFADAFNLGDVRWAQFRKVVQKYVEKDRVVFICKALVEPVLLNSGTTSGFHTRTTLRIVLREEAPQSAEEKPVTRIDSHFSATRYDRGLSDAKTVRASPNLDAGVAGWDEAISRIAHQVESLALDESFEKSSASLL